jgi:hypothetical protein
MCRTFSFCTDKDENLYYFDIAVRKKIIANQLSYKCTDV